MFLWNAIHDFAYIRTKRTTDYGKDFIRTWLQRQTGWRIIPETCQICWSGRLRRREIGCFAREDEQLGTKYKTEFSKLFKECEGPGKIVDYGLSDFERIGYAHMFSIYNEPSVKKSHMCGCRLEGPVTGLPEKDLWILFLNKSSHALLKRPHSRNKQKIFFACATVWRKVVLSLHSNSQEFK